MQNTFTLITENEKLSLHWQQQPEYAPVVVDFLQGATARRIQTHGAELIAKACGLQKNSALTIIDATAGLGRDAFILANAGARVILLERHLLLAELLADGLKRAVQHPAASRMQLHHIDAIDYFSTLTPAHYPDIIYLDPMFAPRRKTALVKKELQMLQALLGHADDNAQALLARARTVCTKRVVVKRALNAPPLAEVIPDMSWRGKTIRFDGYLPQT